MRDVQWTHPHSHSRSCPQSHSLDRCLRSPSRPWQERRVTFWESEVEPDPKDSQRQENTCPPGGSLAYPNAGSRGNYLLDPSIKDIKTWLDWQAHQLDMPCWWMELTTIPGVEDPKKLARKIWASFSIPEVRSQVFLGQRYTALPAPKWLTWKVFLPDELSYQDVWQQPFLLTVAYARGLHYWAGRLNPPVDPDFYPLVRSGLKLRERVKEHIIFTKQDIIQGLGRINPGATSHLPQPTPTGLRRAEPPLPPCVAISKGTYTMFPSTRLQVDDQPVGQNASLMEATTQAVPLPCLGSSWPVLLPHWMGQKRRLSMYWSWPLQ